MSTTDWTTYDEEALDDHYEFAGRLADNLDDPETWESQQAEIDQERERRTKAEAAAEKQRKQRERERYAASPQGKISTLKAELKAAEKELAEMPSVPMGPRVHPDQALDGNPVNAARFDKANVVTNLRGQIAEAESRLPFNGKADDALVEVAAAIEADLAPLREKVKKLDEQLRTRGIADTSFTAQKARADLAEAEAELKPVATEMALRRRDATNQLLIADLASKKVRRMREDALAHWTAEEARLKAQLDDPNLAGLYDFQELQRAREHVQEITAWNEKNPPPTKAELQRARTAMEADPKFKVNPDGSVEALSF